MLGTLKNSEGRNTEEAGIASDAENRLHQTGQELVGVNNIPNSNQMKKCSKCGEEGCLSEFYNNKSRKDGKSDWCKSCSKIYKKRRYDNVIKDEEYKRKKADARRKNHLERKEHYNQLAREYNKNNKEKINNRSKTYYKENRDKIRNNANEYYNNNKGKVCLKKKEYYENNKHYFNRLSREYWKNNKEEIAKYKKKYYENNKSYYNERSQARKRNLNVASLGGVYREETIKIYKEARARELTVDHIWPIKGESWCGLHVPWNMQLISLHENDCKNNKHPHKWEKERKERGF